MREIKFRVWQVSTSKMITAERIRQISVLAMDPTLPEREHFLCLPLLPDFNLMQFTGLHDSEGAEIYEGDIVEFTYWWFDGSERDSYLSGVIVYEEKHMAYALQGIKNKEWLAHIGSEVADTTNFAFFNFEDADFRILGNVHENPDLLHP